MSIPREGSRDIDKGILISSYPDWCKVPEKPCPFPLYAKQHEDANTAPSVRQTSKRSHTTKSIITCSHGDEAGIGLGVESGTRGSICQPKTWSETVRFEGCNVVRHNDEWYMNNKNTSGKMQWVKDVKTYPSTPPFFHINDKPIDKNDAIEVEVDPPTGIESLDGSSKKMTDIDNNFNLQPGMQLASRGMVPTTPTVRPIPPGSNLNIQPRNQPSNQGRTNSHDFLRELNRGTLPNQVGPTNNGRILGNPNNTATNPNSSIRQDTNTPLQGRTSPTPSTPQQGQIGRGDINPNRETTPQQPAYNRYWGMQSVIPNNNMSQLSQTSPSIPENYASGLRLLGDYRMIDGNIIVTNGYAPTPFEKLFVKQFKDTFLFYDSEGELIPGGLEDIEKSYQIYKEQVDAAIIVPLPYVTTQTGLRVSGNNRQRQLQNCGIRPYHLNTNVCGKLHGKVAHHGIVDYPLRTGTRYDSLYRVPGAPSYKDALSICMDPMSHTSLHSSFDNHIKNIRDRNKTVSWQEVRKISYGRLDIHGKGSISEFCLRLFKLELDLQYAGVHSVRDGYGILGWFFGGNNPRLRGISSHNENKPDQLMMNTISKDWGFKWP